MKRTNRPYTSLTSLSRSLLQRLCCAIAILTLATLLPCACRDDGTDEPADGSCVLDLSLASNALSLRTRAASDPEYYIGRVDLFFYTGSADGGNAKPALTMRAVNFDTYDKAAISKGLSESEVETLFPDGATTCTLYAVANIADTIASLASPTINELKATALRSDFPTLASLKKKPVFAMDGSTTVTLDRKTMHMSGTVNLERALAKIMLNISVADTVTVETSAGGTTTTERYVPITANGAIRAELCNSSTRGLLGGVVPDSTLRGYTGDDRLYLKTYTATNNFSVGSADGHTYAEFTHTDPFYSYPNEWASSISELDTSVKLLVPWRKVDATLPTASDGTATEADYIYYYYQIPVNFLGKKIERNHYYRINLKVGMLGSSDPVEPVMVQNPDYEILGWGSDDTSITTDLSKSHYLVVEENSISLWNASDATIGYNTCMNLDGVYLTSVSYESTKYTNDDGSNKTIYLYNTTYNTSTQTYDKVTLYTDADTKEARTQYATTVTYIDTLYDNGHMLADHLDRSKDGSSLGSGSIAFFSDVNMVAGKVYRPVTYTFVLVNDKAHNGMRHYVSITQYPSKYTEYNDGGNVFVNGYYARLVPDAGYSLGDLPNGSARNSVAGDNSTAYYYGYSFTLSGWTSSSSYYYSTDNTYNKNSSINYGSGNPGTSNMYGINTSYEYVRGSLVNSTTLKFTKTIDVHVSAFTADDNSFTVTLKSDNTTTPKTYEYAIGDPRQSGGFVKDPHSTTSTEYVYKESYLYDYYIYGTNKTTTSGGGRPGGGNSSSTTTYYRYVKSWGEEAAKIKVGGTSTGYDPVIAPLFKIQSSYGAAASSVYFKVAQKRCATYQEAGYPAGRWRLPTLAEIAFIVRLQNDGVISQMFNSGATGYWTSSGGNIVANDNMEYTPNYYNSTNTTTVSFVRCVYDLWKWQDGQQKPTHNYYVKPE